MVEKILFPVLISFGIATILGPIVIPFLRRLKVGQTEREELESISAEMVLYTAASAMLPRRCRK